MHLWVEGGEGGVGAGRQAAAGGALPGPRQSGAHLLGAVLVAPSQTLLQLVPLSADALQVLLQLPALPRMPASVSASERRPALLTMPLGPAFYISVG